MDLNLSNKLSRRHLLALAGSAAAFTVACGGLASAASDKTAAEMERLFKGKKPEEGKIKLDLPTIAENGLVVPLGFTVDSPMTEQDYVQSVHIFADGNPNPQVADFHFTPAMPKASAQLRMRLARTQNVIVLAELSSGAVYIAKQEVKVTIGGCGG